MATNHDKLSPPMSRSSVVYEKILTAIIRGEYVVDRKLPTEAQLSATYAVSRPTIREVLARLKEDNLVVSRRGSGSYVTTRPDFTVLQFAKISSISDIQRCFEFRKDLEGGAAKYAAARRTTAQLDTIDKASKSLRKAIELGSIATAEDFSFHLAIAESTNNHYYPTVLKSLRENIQKGMDITRTLTLQASERRLATVQSEHDAVVDAIIEGNGERAREAMTDHLENARGRMFEGA
ncbi:FadR/GntR family transcriptional regulator [Granulosicoccus antarcticus]|uniref:HTH-type transcriptional regulator LutR n=1 Tax=Granulosicoccus antarcticus IMCC3135 TaxID=1192854 RepID=A0A2Z2NRD8_9GAMM|nr:FadR/GntR family transcriptional regulator [Granulosicoccus antarcticus]ASJ73903.1 HTH-type transcriptional regulator LutR [Granulosicoccus antarcticus IMCC3135]